MKKLIFIGLSAILILGLEAFDGPKKTVKKTAKPVAKTTSKTPKKESTAPKVVVSDKDYDVKFDKMFHDFGKANEGDQVETTFVLTNIGKAPVVIMRHEVQCGCTTPEYSKEPIMPGKSTNIKVGFNTNGKLGVNDKVVKLFMNGENMHELKFHCEVVPKPAVDPVNNGQSVKLKTN